MVLNLDPLLHREDLDRATLYHLIYLLFVGALSCLLQESSQYAKLKGVADNYKAPLISHILFVDDTLLFGKTTLEEAINFQRVIQTYERASGQCINLDKFAIVFSPTLACG